MAKRSAAATPILAAGSKGLEGASRDELIGLIGHYKDMRNEYLRRAILERNRIDLLATEVLGYEVQPFHLAMMRFQFMHLKTLQLAFRGAGKSTVCTITKAIFYLLKNPNFRILIASKSSQNAEGFLKEIKGHFERNEKLAEIFGPYYDARKVPKWDNREIEVLPRTSNAKEASITTVGVDGTIVSKHYDAILSDDLVDEDNARTKHMREKTKTWYYQTLDPCLEPPSAEVPHRGEHHHLGTRYHFADQWGYLIGDAIKGEGGELSESYQVIPALNEDGLSPWPEKYPPSWLKSKRAAAGLIIFNAQYQCDTEAMKGEIFSYDDCQIVDESDIPTDLVVFQGVDLAIGEKAKNDKFAHVTIGVQRKTMNYYVLDWFEKQLRFAEQTEKIVSLFHKHDPVRTAIEKNGYQQAQVQQVKAENPALRGRVVGVDTLKDKVTRAQKLSAIFDSKRMFFRKTGRHHLIIEHLVLFPNAAHDDVFDALDLAVRASRMRKRKKRREEPGVF